MYPRRDRPTRAFASARDAGRSRQTLGGHCVSLGRVKPLFLAFLFVLAVFGAVFWFVRARPEATSPPPVTLGPDVDVAAVAEAAAGEPVPVAVAAADRVSAVEPEVEAPRSDGPIVDTTLPASVQKVVVFDERTGAPLPRFVLRFEDRAGRRLEEITDDAGVCVTSQAVAHGSVPIVPLDHPRRRSPAPSVSLDHVVSEDVPVPIRVASGPTYKVKITNASEMPPAALETIELKMRTTNPAEERDEGEYEPLRTEVRYVKPGEDPWVRFPPPPEHVTTIEKIVARTADGLWYAETNASVLRGVSPQALTLEFKTRATLEGVVRDESGPVADAAVTVTARRKGRGPGPRTERTDADGRFRFLGLAPGDVSVSATSPWDSSTSQQLTLPGGQTVTANLTVARKPMAGRIRGKVVSDSGKYARRVQITLTSNAGDASRAPLTRTADFVLHGGGFDFGELPAGNYRLQLVEDDWFEWKPRRIDVTLPDEHSETLEFRVHDMVAAADLVFDVKDADNGIPLRNFHLTLSTFDGDRSMRTTSGRIVYEAYPEDRRLLWRLDADGYPPVTGTLDSFAVRTISDGRLRRTCEVNLRPGWGEYVRAENQRNRRAIAGVAVLVDGHEVAKTDEQGYALVSARDKPSSVTLKLDGWNTATLDLTPALQRKFPRVNVVGMRARSRK